MPPTRVILVLLLGVVVAAAAGPLEDARRLAADGENLQALERVRQALAEDASDPSAMLLEGVLLSRMGQVDEAMTWYERSIWLAPHLSDPWYHVGLLNEGKKQWLTALDAYERALDLDHFEQVGRSSPAYRMGLIYQRQLEPPRISDARMTYKAALQADDFRSRKDHAWAHARLGQVSYALEKDAPAAESEIQEALALAPEDKWLHLVLGDLYRDEGQLDRAAKVYQQALDLAPGFQAAQRRLDAINLVGE